MPTASSGPATPLASIQASFNRPLPATPPGTNEGKRWPYGSSFQLPAAFYDQGGVGIRISQGSTHSTHQVPTSASFGAHPVPNVAFPSQKVHFADTTAWHLRPRASHSAFADMRLPFLFCDGAVAVRASADANPGWQPNSPTSAAPTTYSYQPEAWEAPTLSGASSEPVPAGRFRWTRGGITGRDFGGPEVCTGQPGCP